MRAPRGVKALYSPHAKLRREKVQHYINKIIEFSEELKLTERQKQVLELIFSGVSQKDTAKILGIHQTSVQKCLFGNLVCSGKYKDCRHGGILAKVRKAVYKNDALKEYRIRLEDLNVI